MNELDDLLNALTSDEPAAEGEKVDTAPAAVAEVAPTAPVDDSLDSLLGELAAAETAPEPVAEPVAIAPTADTTGSDLDGLLEALTTPSSEVPAEAPAAPAKAQGKGKGSKTPKTQPAVAKEAQEQPKPEAANDEAEKPEAEKKERQARIFFAKKTDRIMHKLGDKLAEYTLLELPEGDLTDEVIEAEKKATLAMIDKLGVKPQQRATFIIEFVAGKSATLNAVIAEAFKLLHTEGKVEMGNDGNLWKALSARYSAGSARAMGGNTLIAMKALKVLNEDGKTLNPKSLIYPAVIERLGLVGQEVSKAA